MDSFEGGRASVEGQTSYGLAFVSRESATAVSFHNGKSRETRH